MKLRPLGRGHLITVSCTKVTQCVPRSWMCKHSSISLLSCQPLPAFHDENSQKRLTFYPSDFPTILAAEDHQFDHEEQETFNCAYLPLCCHISFCTEIRAVLEYWAISDCTFPTLDTIRRSYPKQATERWNSHLVIFIVTPCMLPSLSNITPTTAHT